MQKDLSQSSIDRLSESVTSLSSTVGTLGGRMEGIGHEISGMRLDIREQSVEIKKLSEKFHERTGETTQRIKTLEDKILKKRKSPSSGDIDVRNVREEAQIVPWDKKVLWLCTGAAIGGASLWYVGRMIWEKLAM